MVRGDYGADVIDGGKGIDWAGYGHSVEVNVDLSEGADEVLGAAEGDTLKTLRMYMVLSTLVMMSSLAQRMTMF